MDEVRGIYGGFPEAILDRGATSRRLWHQRHLAWDRTG